MTVKHTPITVQTIIDAMEALAPLQYAEHWDNPGLMVGARSMPVERAVTTLDVTREAVDYAVEHRCQMIVSHHPFIFKGLTSIDLDSYAGRIIRDVIKHDIAIYSAHTNLDIAPGGLNDMLAQRLGLEHVEGFIRIGESKIYKLSTFVPADAADGVRLALADAGAGRMGNYDTCSFSVAGSGRFRGNDASNPVIGERGTLTVVGEEQINTIVPESLLPSVIDALMDAHPYEEVAYEVIPLTRPKGAVRYLGRVGHLPRPLSMEACREWLQTALPHGDIRFAGPVPDRIRTVALCSGGGAEFIKDAAARNVDLYITGDLKYHDAQSARELGICVADAGHFGTEEIVASGLASYLESVAAQREWSVEIRAFEEQRDFFFR